MTCYSLDSQWSVACGQKLFSRLFIYNLTVLGNCMFKNTILLKRSIFENWIKFHGCWFKKFGLWKCFKSACKSEHFKMNCMFLRDFKMRKKSKFEQNISIIIDPIVTRLLCLCRFFIIAQGSWLIIMYSWCPTSTQND